MRVEQTFLMSPDQSGGGRTKLQLARDEGATDFLRGFLIPTIKGLKPDEKLDSQRLQELASQYREFHKGTEGKGNLHLAWVHGVSTNIAVKNKVLQRHGEYVDDAESIENVVRQLGDIDYNAIDYEFDCGVKPPPEE